MIFFHCNFLRWMISVGLRDSISVMERLTEKTEIIQSDDLLYPEETWPFLTIHTNAIFRNVRSEAKSE